MAITLVIDVDGWPDAGWAALAQRSAQAAAEAEPLLANHRLSASLLFTSDGEIRALNHEWRGKDRPTNVLSFPMMSRRDLAALAAKGPPELIGDIALAHETCTREAAEKDAALEHHVAHLIIHGLLHLAGHDHVDSDAQAGAMEALEIRALEAMGIADPYGDRT